MGRKSKLTFGEVVNLTLLIFIPLFFAGGWIWDNVFSKNDVAASDRMVRHETTGPTGVPKSSGAPAPQVVQMVDRGNAEFEPYSGFSEELFPSRVLSMAGRAPSSQYRNEPGMAPRYGILGTIGVLVRNVRRGERYAVEIVGDRLIGSSQESFTIFEDAPVVVMCPRINYDYANLRRNTQTTFINLSFKVLKDGQADGPSATRRWQVHQINDCPIELDEKYVMHDGQIQSRRKSQSYVVAGYVNENHPWIDTLLMEAKSTGICNEFIGYQGGHEKIWPQIAAIWKALQNRGLSYSSVSTSTSSKFHALQHIRFLDQSIAATQANCIDGSVLLCSMLRKIGLNVGVMLVPRHAYVCVFDEKMEHWLFAIETTMLGNADLAEAVKMATQSGEYPLEKWNDDKSGAYDIVDLTKLRKEGIQPIPFDELAAMPAMPAQAPPAVLQYQSPQEWARQKKEWARQQRIIIANKLRQQVIDLQGNLAQRNDERFRISAFNLFNEIRKNQTDFNAMPYAPSLVPTGIRNADDQMQARYGEIVRTLRTKSVPINAEINEEGLNNAKTVVDALVELANLPLDF